MKIKIGDITHKDNIAKIRIESQENNFEFSTRNKRDMLSKKIGNLLEESTSISISPFLQCSSNINEIELKIGSDTIEDLDSLISKLKDDNNITFAKNEDDSIKSQRNDDFQTPRNSFSSSRKSSGSFHSTNSQDPNAGSSSIATTSTAQTPPPPSSFVSKAKAFFLRSLGRGPRSTIESNSPPPERRL